MQFQEIRQAASQGTISLPPPRDSEILEDATVLKACLQVTRLIGDFREAYTLSKMPLTFGHLMTIVEAANQLSKRGSLIDLRRFFLSEIVPLSDEGTLLLENYLRACEAGRAELNGHPVSIDTIVRVANEFPQDKINWRKNQDSFEDKLFLPSEALVSSKELQNQLNRWEEYAGNSRDMEPLVHLILANLYFVAISPLSRHNERIGQILFQLGLMGENLHTPVACVQMGRALHTNAHFGVEERLHGLRTRQWSPYLNYMLRTLAKAFTLTLELLTALNRLYDATETYFKLIGLDTHVAFLPVIFDYPACRTGEFSGKTGTRRQVSSHILNDFAHAGILERVEEGRDKIFYHKRLIELLDSDTYTYSPFPASMDPFIPLYQKGGQSRQRKEVQALSK